MTKILRLLLAIAIAVGVLSAIAPTRAMADLAPGPGPTNPANGSAVPSPAPTDKADKADNADKPPLSDAPPPRASGFPDERSPHGDRVEAHDPMMALLFWAFAAACVGGALFVVSRKNLIAAVMGMVGSFLGIAAVYMMLYASFLAVLQMLVYAGAIMVLFVFVIMILNRPEDEPVAPSGRGGQIVGGLAIAYLIGRLAFLLMAVNPPAGAAAVADAQKQLARATQDLHDAEDKPPSPQSARQLALGSANLTAAETQLAKVSAAAAPAPVNGHPFGSIKAVGTDLFDGGLFPFEAISILLLVAVVGAIAIARPLKEDPHVDGNPVGPHHPEEGQA